MNGRTARLREQLATRFPRLRFILTALAAIAAVWATTVAHTDGFELTAYGVRVFSTRGSRNPMVIAVVSALLAWWLSSDTERLALERRLQPVESPRAAHLAACILALTVTFVSIVFGAFIVGGSDSYGYVSQAHLLARGAMHIEQPIMQSAARAIEPTAFTPLGWRPSVDNRSIVPTYSFGYPLLMAAAERMGGPRAVFYVLPVLAGVAVLATYALGLTLAGPIAGLGAACLLATSPAFLFHVMVAMSDVPVTAWWAVSLALLFLGRRGARFGAGLASGLAIVTRPNIVPLAVLPPIYLLYEAVRGGITRTGVRRGLANAAVFTVGPVLASVAVGVVNATLYGSPLLSGYGASEALFSRRFILPNVVNYASWLTLAQTPLVWLFALAPLVRRAGRDPRTPPASALWLGLAFWATLVACYLPYLEFEYWLYLRFLLPAFPLLFLLLVVTIDGLAARAAPAFRTTIVICVVGALAWRGFTFTLERDGFRFHRGERKFQIAGDYIARELPPNAALFALLHSGSARYYGGRLTLRFDLLGSGTLDGAVAELERLGMPVYFVMESTDETPFRTLFAGVSRYGALDWPPVATLHEEGTGTVRVWEARQASAR